MCVSLPGPISTWIIVRGEGILKKDISIVIPNDTTINPPHEKAYNFSVFAWDPLSRIKSFHFTGNLIFNHE